MKGQISITQQTIEECKILGISIGELTKLEIGKALKLGDPSRHCFGYYAEKICPTTGNHEFLFDTEINYKIKQIERTNKKEGWKRNLENAGWRVHI